MPIIWHTKNINIQSYYKIIRRIIMLNGNDGTHLSGYRAWQEFKSDWILHVIPVDQAEDYKQFYEHYGQLQTERAGNTNADHVPNASHERVALGTQDRGIPRKT